MAIFTILILPIHEHGKLESLTLEPKGLFSRFKRTVSWVLEAWFEYCLSFPSCLEISCPNHFCFILIWTQSWKSTATTRSQYDMDMLFTCLKHLGNFSFFCAHAPPCCTVYLLYSCIIMLVFILLLPNDLRREGSQMCVLR